MALSCSAAMWDLPGPELEPTSPTLAGGFLTTAPPGKSENYNLNGGWHLQTPIHVHLLIIKLDSLSLLSLYVWDMTGLTDHTFL